MREVIPIGVAVVALFSSLISAMLVRSGQREQNSVDRRKVDVEAFQRARETYDQIIRTLEGQVERLKQDLAGEMLKNQELRMTLVKLETTVRLLRHALTVAGIQTPPEIE